MEEITSAGSFIERFGLPLFMLLLASLAWFKGWVRAPRDVEREREATEREKQATARERELTVEQAGRFDKAMTQIDKLADGQERLVAAVERLAGGAR